MSSRCLTASARIALLFVVAAGCSRAPRERPAPPAPARPIAPPTVAPVVVTTPDVPTPDVPTPDAGCVATPRNAFHLRPTESFAAAGAELPAGTELTLLGRARHSRRATEMFRVRVRATGAEGYVFLALRELGGCPFAWSEPLADVNPGAPLDEFEQCLVTSGWKPTRAATLTPAARDGRITRMHRLVVDGDGVPDEIVSLAGNGCAGEEQYALIQHGPAGWRALYLGADGLSEHHGYELQRPLVTSTGVLLVTHGSESFDGDEGSSEQHDFYRFSRLRPDGELQTVWAAGTFNNTYDAWSFTDGGGGDVVVRSDTLARTQRLRWNAARYRFE